MQGSEPRRRSSRFPLRWKAAVVFESANGRPIVHTQTQDLSVIGAAILSDHGDLTGAVVTLLLAYPSRKANETPRVLKVRARVVSTVRTPGMTQYRHGLSFLRVADDGLDDLEAILGGAASAARIETPPLPAAPAGAIGRLAQLRQLAQARQAEGTAADPQHFVNTLVSEALEKAYYYLKDLVEQLNVIKPEFPKGYAIAGLPEFNGLAWAEGHADFHAREWSPTEKYYDRVSLRFRLAADRQIRVAREYPASEKLKQLLADCGIEFNSQDRWSARGSIEQTTFLFPCELKGNLWLQGRFDTGKLLLRARNVAGFGVVEHVIAPEAVSDEALDELTAFILAETTRLGPLLLRNA
jgi:hypothetical protein